MLSKLAVEIAKPDSQHIINIDNIDSSINTLPIRLVFKNRVFILTVN